MLDWARFLSVRRFTPARFVPAISLLLHLSALVFDFPLQAQEFFFLFFLHSFSAPKPHPRYATIGRVLFYPWSLLGRERLAEAIGRTWRSGMMKPRKKNPAALPPSCTGSHSRTASLHGHGDVQSGVIWFSKLNFALLRSGWLMITRAVFLDCHERSGPTGAPSFAMDVNIGDDCWIGGRVTILGGVSIGRGCAIGAGSLVTKVSCLLYSQSRIPFSSTPA